MWCEFYSRRTSCCASTIAIERQSRRGYALKVRYSPHGGSCCAPPSSTDAIFRGCQRCFWMRACNRLASGGRFGRATATPGLSLDAIAGFLAIQDAAPSLGTENYTPALPLRACTRAARHTTQDIDRVAELRTKSIPLTSESRAPHGCGGDSGNHTTCGYTLAPRPWRSTMLSVLNGRRCSHVPLKGCYMRGNRSRPLRVFLFLHRVQQYFPILVFSFFFLPYSTQTVSLLDVAKSFASLP